MLVVIAAVDLVGAPDIDHGLRASLIIYAAIQDERLVGPFCEWVGIDEGLRPGRLETGTRAFVCCSKASIWAYGSASTQLRTPGISGASSPCQALSFQDSKSRGFAGL